MPKKQAEDAEGNLMLLGVAFACPCCCCFLPFLICLIGAGSLFSNGMYRGGDLGASEYILLKSTEEPLTPFSFKVFHFIEVNADTWGVDLGKFDAGAIEVATAEASAGAYTGTNKNVSRSKSLNQAAKIKEVEHEGKKLFKIDNVCPIPSEGPSTTYESDCEMRGLKPVHLMSNLRFRTAIMIIVTFIVKLYKYFLLAAKVAPQIDDGIPTNLYQLYINLEDNEDDSDFLKCIKPLVNQCVSTLWVPIDFVLLTWAPNLAILPLTSIQARSDYENMGQMQYNGEVFPIIIYGFFTGIICFLILVVADTCFEQKTIKAGEYDGLIIKWTFKCLRCLLICCRALLLFMIVGIMFIAISQMMVSVKVAVGIEFSAVFNWSFRFGLLSWTTFLRFFSSCMVMIELPLTILFWCVAYATTERQP